MAFSRILGLIMSTIILTILWIIGFGFYAIVLKLIGIPSRFRKAPETFWLSCKSDPIEHIQYPF